jgi:uncharacterized linocin/CFP29 family protein
MKTLDPIPPKAWNEIKDVASTILHSALSARKIVDLEGPKGMDYPAVPLGRLQITEDGKKNEVRYGIHRINPMIELKVPFTLDIREVETIDRGAKDADLDPVELAASKLASAEDKIIYQGYNKAGITGLSKTKENKNLKWPDEISDIPGTITEAILTLQNKNIDGPYSLVLDADKWTEIHTMTNVYPVMRQIKDIVDGQIVLNKNTNDSMLVSERGDDFIFTLGQDISLGYEYQNQEDLRLYLLESFTFLIAEPRAVVLFN